ncbi:hypothetical protein HPB48_018259 [Haemaphysalis longicornis]|uniref:Uncharacterized protein n=1 Tax=Haemaphysalis longicornis TaxID=44386 RepID=A0A9J6GDE7_HAELO|nr:hypothetical protein HPB48_018259 [Haemaphysalis longicornis]
MPHGKKKGGAGAQEPGPASDSGEVLSGLMAEVTSIHIQLDALLSLKTELSKLATTVRDMEESVSFLSKRYDTVLGELKSTQEKAVSREAELQSVKEMVQTQAHQLEQILREQNEAEQYSREANMEIHGLTMGVKENLSE